VNVLDTNVISALMRRTPDPKVVAWLDRQPATSVWTTSVCVFEIRMGIEILPAGKQREFLDRAFEQILTTALAGRVLDLNPAAATEAARLYARLRADGVGIEFRDLLIAGTVAARNGTLATRNLKHFVATGVPLADPWA